MALNVLLQLCEDKQEIIAQPSLLLDGTAEMPIQRLKGKRWNTVPEAITWMGSRLILQAEQYQTALWKTRSHATHCRPCSDEHPALVCLGSRQHRCRNLIISI